MTTRAMMPTRGMIMFCLCVLGVLQTSSGLSRESTMKLDNNRYTNMVIAIHDSVAENKTLLDTLKTTMTKASQYLYKATRQRAFFGDITIMVPSTWSADASYSAHTTESMRLADVIITNPTRGKRSLPQTRSYDGCGKQGVHVLVTQEFLTTPRVEPYYNDPGKYFVHAFAQFRWGVYQEYAEEGESLFYISLTSGHPEAIRCVYYIRGLIQKNDTAHTICYTSIDKATGLYTPDCQWRPYPTRQRLVSASMMDHQYIQQIETFCDDNTTNHGTIHNYEAPSKHNRLCSHRSTWSIITNTDDFKGNTNPPRHVTNVTPTFKVVRAVQRRKRAVVLTDQQSESNMQTIIGRLKHETDQHDIHVTHYHHGNSREQGSLTETADEMHEIKQQTNGGRNKDFLAMVKNIADDTEDVSDVHLVVVGDVTEHYPHVTNMTKHTGLKVSYINISPNNARDVERTTDISLQDAHEVHHVGQTTGHDLLDRLRHIILDDDVYTKYTLIKLDQFPISQTKNHSDGVDFDLTLESKGMLVFHYESTLPTITLTSPSGTVFNMEYKQCTIDEHLKLIRFNFDVTESGHWRCFIQSPDGIQQTISLTVSAIFNQAYQDPFVIRTSVKHDDEVHGHLVMHADVTQGSHPVIGLNVSTKVETPSGDTVQVVLLDNGAGADITKDDGVYSRYLTSLQDGGHYHVSYMITGGNGNRVFRKEQTFDMDESDADSEQVKVPLKKLTQKIAIIGTIQRHVNGGSIYYDVPTSELAGTTVDMVSPSRIVDLEVVKVLPYRNTVVVRWTAPGDDLDTGKVQRYEVFVGQGIKDVRNLLTYATTSQHVGKGRLFTELYDPVMEATGKEHYLFKVPVRSDVYAFAVRAVDSSGNKGEVSNVATATIKHML